MSAPRNEHWVRRAHRTRFQLAPPPARRWPLLLAAGVLAVALAATGGVIVGARLSSPAPAAGAARGGAPVPVITGKAARPPRRKDQSRLPASSLTRAAARVINRRGETVVTRNRP